MGKSNHEAEYNNLTREELAALGKRSAEGDLAARNTLILAHMDLVDQILPLYGGQGVDDEDLFQEGCYGLIEAVDRYDYTKDVLLTTYATHWIRKRMGLALISQNMKTPINIPSDKIYYALRRYTRCRLDLTDAHGRTPSIEEIAAALRISVEKAKTINQYFFAFTNLDVDSREEGDARPRFTPVRNCAPSAEEEAFDIFFRTEFPISVAQLTLRQREILSRRCGFTPSGEPETIEQVAAAMHVSRQTVCTDYMAAINALRKSLSEDSD